MGALEAVKEDATYDRFAFRNVDLVPMDDPNLYGCGHQPRHFPIAMDQVGFWLPFAGHVGGLWGVSKAPFLRIGGFRNEYWGWGGEDDDIPGLPDRDEDLMPRLPLGRSPMIKHDRDEHNKPNPQRFTKIQNTKLARKQHALGQCNIRS